MLLTCRNCRLREGGLNRNLSVTVLHIGLQSFPIRRELGYALPKGTDCHASTEEG